MRKSNWIILAVLVIASVFFLWLWYYLRFDVVDHPRDLVLSIVWWVVVVAAVIGIHQAEKLRRRRVRTAYVAPGCIFNSEAGVVRLERGESTIAALQQMVAGLSYGFDAKEMPRRSQVRYTYIVHTDKFGNDGDTWEGDVVKVSRSDKAMPFANRNELMGLLGEPAQAAAA